MDVDPEVQRAFERVHARVWDDDAADEDASALASLSAAERAVYLTRTLETSLSENGWYYIFADEDDDLIAATIEAYELLGLPAYASHLRDVAATYGDASSEDEGDRFDAAYAMLRGAEAARAALLRDRPL